MSRGEGPVRLMQPGTHGSRNDAPDQGRELGFGCPKGLFRRCWAATELPEGRVHSLPGRFDSSVAEWPGLEVLGEMRWREGSVQLGPDSHQGLAGSRVIVVAQ